MLTIHLTLGSRTFSLMLSRYIQKLYYFGPDYREREWGWNRLDSEGIEPTSITLPDKENTDA